MRRCLRAMRASLMIVALTMLAGCDDSTGTDGSIQVTLSPAGTVCDAGQQRDNQYFDFTRGWILGSGYAQCFGAACRSCRRHHAHRTDWNHRERDRGSVGGSVCGAWNELGDSHRDGRGRPGGESGPPADHCNGARLPVHDHAAQHDGECGCCGQHDAQHRADKLRRRNPVVAPEPAGGSHRVLQPCDACNELGDSYPDRRSWRDAGKLSAPDPGNCDRRRREDRGTHAHRAAQNRSRSRST